MVQKRKKKGWKINHNDVLKEKVTISAHELVRLIHRINPTGKNIPTKKEAERYKIKARLQSLLIRRFNEGLLVTQPDPENPRLVAFELRHYDETACHALIDELDEDARAWAQRQIDEDLTERITGRSLGSTESSETAFHSSKPYSTTDTAKHPQSSKTEVKEELSKDELIQRGHNALAEYDYDACETYYRRAVKLSPDSPDSVLSLLELYVDHLAAYEKALALSDSVPRSVKKSDEVEILLALAAARCGRIDSALEHIKRIIHPSASEVYLISANHFVQEGDLKGASELLGILKSFEQVELEPEVEELDKKIQSLQAKEFEPIEQEMISAWQQGRTRESLGLADRLLSVSPENKAARRIHREFEKQQLEDRISQLLRLADKAKENKAFAREAELLNNAIAIGAKAKNLVKRLKYAQNEAKRKKEEIETHSVINLWTEGNKKKALMQYVGLNTQQRSHIKSNRYDPHFAWLDKALSTQTTPKPEKLIEAVLALGRSVEALDKGKEPDNIITEMKLHSKILQSVPEAHDILQQAERISRTIEHKKAKDSLDSAMGFLEMGHLEKARDSIDRIEASHLNENEKKIFEDINQRCHYLEKVKRLEQRYTDAHDRADHFAAREIAAELAEHTERETSVHWLDRLAEETSLIEKEWSMTSVDIGELPGCYACIGLEEMTEEISCCLLPDGHHLVFATGHERWVFLRIFCLDDQKLKKAIIFRAPVKVSRCNIYPVGNVLWIAGQDAFVLELSLEPLNILSRFDLSDAVRPDKAIDGVWLFPKSRSLWLYRGISGSFADETLEVINIDQQRVVRRLKPFGYPTAINTGGDFCMAIQNTMTKTVQIYSEKGKPVESFAFEDHKTIHAATIHPNAGDFVLLPFDDSGAMEPFLDLGEAQGDLVINLEVRPDPKGKYQPVRIENTNGELHHSACTSLDAGIAVILFADDSMEDSDYSLAAFKDTGLGFDLLYQVSVPTKFILACDEFSRRVAAINFQNNKLQAVVLNENAPVFESESGNPIKNGIPEFDATYCVCNNPTGSFNATSLAHMMHIRNSSPRELYETIRDTKQSGSKAPDEIAAFIHALYRTFHMDEMVDMKMWMRIHHPGHFSVLSDLAEEAAREKKWPEVVSLLEGISRTDLDDGTACHVCHLLGMGYFIGKDPEKALRTWTEGKRYEDGRCDLDPYIEYAKLSLMPAKKRKKKKSGILRELNVFESVDNHLADGKYSDAIETIEKTDALSKDELQILARLTWAYLHQDFVRGEMQWVCKVIALANYCGYHSQELLSANQVLPSYMETWPEGRLGDIAVQAEQWLKDL